MTKTAKKPLTLGDLVRVDAELTIKWDLELPQNSDVYRGIIPDYSEEIDFETAQAYLLRKDHPAHEVEQALEPYFETNETAITVINDDLNLDDALGILKKQKTLFDKIEDEKRKETQKRLQANFIYRDIQKTKYFLLDNLKGTGIELKFKSLICSETEISRDVADVIIRGWKYFVAVHVSIQDHPESYGYCMGFAPWHVQITNFSLGEASPWYPFNEDRGSRLLPSSAQMAKRMKIDYDCIYSCFDSPYYSKIFDHLIKLRIDAGDAIKKRAVDAENERIRIENESNLSLMRLLDSKENLEGKVDKGQI